MTMNNRKGHELVAEVAKTSSALTIAKSLNELVESTNEVGRTLEKVKFYSYTLERILAKIDEPKDDIDLLHGILGNVKEMYADIFSKYEELHAYIANNKGYLEVADVVVDPLSISKDEENE